MIPAPPARVWAYLVRIASHVEWMADADAIRFRTDQREGVGTAFETDTKVGPFRLKDQMVITEWEAGRVMGIRHTGVVTGTGRFTLEEVPGGLERSVPTDPTNPTAPIDPPVFTRFTWQEDLRFPAWMGGALGGHAGAPVLKRIWQRNLANLRRHFE